MSFLDLFSLGFMQRALIAALLTGLAAPAIGTFIVQRRLALLGDGIGHVAVTGVALGLLTGTSPTWTAVVVAVLAIVLDLLLGLLQRYTVSPGLTGRGTTRGAPATAATREPVLDAVERARRRGDVPDATDADALVDMLAGGLVYRRLLLGEAADEAAVRALIRQAVS